MKNIIVALLSVFIISSCSKDDHPLQTSEQGFESGQKDLKILSIVGDTVTFKNNKGLPVRTHLYLFRTHSDSAVFNLYPNFPALYENYVNGSTEDAVIAAYFHKIDHLKTYKVTTPTKFNFRKDTLFLYRTDTINRDPANLKIDTTLVEMYLPVIAKKL